MFKFRILRFKNFKFQIFKWQLDSNLIQGFVAAPVTSKVYYTKFSTLCMACACEAMLRKNFCKWVLCILMQVNRSLRFPLSSFSVCGQSQQVYDPPAGQFEELSETYNLFMRLNKERPLAN